MARYTSPRWKQAPGGHWWYYGDFSERSWTNARQFCYAVVDYADRPVGVREPGGSVGDGMDHYFPDLETAKIWVEIEASNG